MKKNILLIDDNKYLLDVFVIRLSMALKNYKILTARSGKQGLEILKSTSVDFVLTDLDMPEMNGYEFIEQAQRHFPSVPVYAVSNECTEEVARRLHSLGISECIDKPFLVEEVRRALMNRAEEKKSAGSSDEQQTGLKEGLVLSTITN
jgi:two-component system chemotaxis response regulator CheY